MTDRKSNGESRGERIEEGGAGFEMTDEAKKLMKRKTIVNELIDKKGFKSLKSGTDPADFTNESKHRSS